MKKKISIIGGGPASLMLAVFLDQTLFDITIFEKNKTLGRKFLVAGKGGFNLTHAEPIASFLERYTPPDFLKAALLNFDNKDLQQWLSQIGISTFTGSSNRVFPTKEIKPIQVLNAILTQVKKKNIQICPQHEWVNWDSKGDLIFKNKSSIQSDFCIFALGGGSWKITGSDGSWLEIFKNKGLQTKPFQAANCAYQVNWPTDFILKNEGKPLKNIAISCGSKKQKGEVVVTRFGLEGNAIYALSPEIQNLFNTQKTARIFLDLKPTFDIGKVYQKLSSPKQKNTTDTLRTQLKLNNIQINLLKSHLSKEDFLSIDTLSKAIKQFPLDLISAAPIDEAISTTGGIVLEELTQNYEFKKLKNTFCIGEMINWNAPTGGYLLQACFSMGVYLARYLNGLDR